MKLIHLGFAALSLGLLTPATAIAQTVCGTAEPAGFAAVNALGQNGTTGGAGGEVVVVSTEKELRKACDEDGPRVIQVKGSIALNSQVPVGADKTVIGLGSGAEIVGRAFLIEGVKNVIIRNLTIRDSTGDGITIEDGAHHIWIDHCTLMNAKDGCLDVSRGSDYITVSWCVFKYTRDNGHNFASLVGSDDKLASQDGGRLRVTYHHNWWAGQVRERMPRVRYGRIHSYNNFYNAPGNNYCIRAGVGSEIFSEKNYFKDVAQPLEFFVSEEGAGPGKIRDEGSAFDNVTAMHPAADAVFKPEYTYTTDAAADIPAKVRACAGAGRLDEQPTATTANANTFQP